MSKLFRKSISLAMFVVFMANPGVWNFQAKWLAHEIEHSTGFALMTLQLDHADAHHHDGEDDGPSASEHQLMHAFDHLQLFPGTTVIAHFSLPHDPVLADFSLPSVTLAASESPYRPPRNTPSLV